MAKDLLLTTLKSSISVIVLFLLTRLMGKKQLSQLTSFDYIVGISIGSIAASFAIDPFVNYVKGLTAMLIYSAFLLIFSYISLKSYKARKFLDGVPLVLIQNGVVIEENLKKSKLTVNDFLEECRLKNAFNISDIEFAIFETSGKLSVQMKSSKLSAKDMNIPVADKGLCVNVIIDGQISLKSLQSAGKSQQWLTDELKNQNIFNPKDVLLAYVDIGGKLYVHMKKPPIHIIKMMD